MSAGASDCQDLQDELHRKFNVADFLECVSSSEVLQGRAHFLEQIVSTDLFFLLCVFFLFFLNCISFDLSCDVNKTKAKPRPAALTSGGEELTPPQLSVLARSFPVPRGRTATGGWGFICSSSRVERIQPTFRERLKLPRESVSSKQIKAGQALTVPSPPQARTRRFGTFRYNSNLRNQRASRGKRSFSPIDFLPALSFDVFPHYLKIGLRINKPQPPDVKTTLTQREAEAGRYSRLSQSPLRQVKHLSRIQDPHKHL